MNKNHNAHFKKGLQSCPVERLSKAKQNNKSKSLVSSQQEKEQNLGLS